MPCTFPPFSTTGELAAEQYIARQILVTPGPQYGIRGLYWQDDSISWSDKATALMSCTDPCPTSPCAESYAAVCAQLRTEFGYVDTVRNYFAGETRTTLKSIYAQAMLEGDLVADLLVSDWGRLQTAVARIGRLPDRDDGWGFGTEAQANLVDVLTTNIQQYLWQAMLSVPLGVGASVNDPTRGSFRHRTSSGSTCRSSTPSTSRSVRCTGSR